MAIVPLHKAPLSQSGHLALLRLEKLAARQASKGDYIGTEDVESILRVVRELAESEATLLTTRPTPEAQEARDADTKRLDYIERTFSGVTNRERYLPVQMIWGKGCNGRTLREACDKYMKRDAALALPAQGEG